MFTKWATRMIKYYDCPLEAALMAKNHGVEYMQGTTSPKHKFRLEDFYTYFNRVVDFIKPIKGLFFYIHPDSLHIFEPQLDDMVIVLPNIKKGSNYYHELKNVGWVSEPFKNLSSGKIVDNVFVVGSSPKDCLGYIRDIKFLRVIQRNNQAFIMPKEKE